MVELNKFSKLNTLYYDSVLTFRGIEYNCERKAYTFTYDSGRVWEQFWLHMLISLLMVIDDDDDDICDIPRAICEISLLPYKWPIQTCKSSTYKTQTKNLDLWPLSTLLLQRM